MSSWCGTRARSSAVLEVEPREMPSVELYPGPHQKVSRGGSVMVQCRWGPGVIITCHDNIIRTMTGIPQPVVTWTREDGRSLTGGTEVLEGGVLRIIGVTEEEAGTYICQAENIVGMATARASIQIEDIEEWRQRPTPPTRSPQYNQPEKTTTEGYNYEISHPSEDRTATHYDTERPRITRPRHNSDNISVITNTGADVDLNCVAYPHITRPASGHQSGDVVWSRTDGREIDPRHRVEGGQCRIDDKISHYRARLLLRRIAH